MRPQSRGASVPTIQAGHIVDKRVPEVGTAGSLLAGADLMLIFAVALQEHLGFKTRIQNKNSK